MKLALINNKLYRIQPHQVPHLPDGTYIWGIGDPIALHFETGNAIFDIEGPYMLDFPFSLKKEYRSIPEWHLVNDWSQM